MITFKLELEFHGAANMYVKCTVIDIILRLVSIYTAKSSFDYYVVRNAHQV